MLESCRHRDARHRLCFTGRQGEALHYNHGEHEGGLGASGMYTGQDACLRQIFERPLSSGGGADEPS